MSTAKKQYSAQEKAKVALEAIKGELTLAQISSKYKVHATQINRWRKEALEAIITSFTNPTKANNDNNDNELIDKLYQQIGQLTTECEWLKKKSMLFKY